MVTPDLFEKALQIALSAHRGQKDRAGAPYILHPLGVMARVRTIEEKTLAILHDVVEDSDWTLDRLRQEGFPEDILAALDCVTKREGEDYEHFVERTAGNRLAIRVKLADLLDNMDLQRNANLSEKDLPRLRKYLAAYRKLEAVTIASVAP